MSRKLILPMLLPCVAIAADPGVASNEIIVTTSREAVLRAETPISISVVDSGLIDQVRPGHPAEILGRVPGVAVEPTNGEGSIVGIRQPIGTSPVYLYLEDGVPVRASGFFNHNAMYETNLPQSGGVEVIRGPGTALQGSDAIGGVVNVLTRAPSAEPTLEGTFEVGEDTWLRGLISASGTRGDLAGRADLNITHSDGWRDKSGYDRQSITLRGDQDLGGDRRVKATFSATNIEQDTGALSYLSREDYRNNPTRNYTPIAYRKVKSARASVDFSQAAGPGELTVTPYWRWSEMELLPTWQLTYDPVVYSTSYFSVGTLLKYRQDFAPWNTRLITGVDLDYSPGGREEDRIWANRVDGVFESYTNEGRIYDYNVTFWQTSPYMQVETSPVERLRLTAGLRYDLLGFRYENHLGDGAFETKTTSVGTPRNFYRPEDQNVDFDRLSPSLGATWEFTPSLNGFIAWKQSFRVPQEGQLFRPGTNQGSTDLKPVKADSYEVGLRGTPLPTLSWELSVYTMEKRDDILTYNDGAVPTQTNNGETTHKGIEAALGWTFLPEWRLDVAYAHSKSEFDKWRVSGTSDPFDGNTMPAAPENIANTTLAYSPGWLKGLNLEAEWVYMGSYWLNEANTEKYDGHNLVNLRLNYDTGGHWQLFLRATNLFDTRWANSAQVSNGQPQFAPGLPLTVYGGASWKF